MAKRGRTGLSDAEADELGRLFAEREGKPYSNAAIPRKQTSDGTRSSGLFPGMRVSKPS